jgi:uncharacterized protein (TIGR00369 family)
VDDNDCFACGLDNPVGLKLKFSIEEGSGRSLCRTVIPGHFSGWRGAAHGGIITTLLDETMVYACTSIGWLTVTGTITVKFHRPVPTETPLEVTGTVLRNRGRSITAEGSITVGGVLLASAEGVFIPLKELENPLETFRDRLVP